MPSETFRKTVTQLDSWGGKLAAGEITPPEFDLERERLLADALVEVAKDYDVVLSRRLMHAELLHIDIKGEMTLMGGQKDGGFGEEFYALLKDYNPRAVTADEFCPSSTACAINHEEVERMVRDYARTHGIEVAAIPLYEIDDDEPERGPSR
jgi:hypothetical protein